MKNHKIELVLEGLNCANCATKIEDRAQKIDDVNKASLNFLTKTLVMETNNIDKIDTIIEKAKGIVNKLEPHVIVKNLDKEKHTFKKEERNQNKSDKKKLINLALGAILFGIVTITQFSFWVEWIIYLVSYFLVGKDVLLKSAKNISRGQVFDENFLMGIATIGAFAIQEFPEAIAVMLFYEAGEFLQDIAVNRSRKSIKTLMDIRPDYANLKTLNDIKRVSPEDVKIGDVIIVKPGERIPLDGKVINGRSMLDTSALTGESVPWEVKNGDSILSGSINKNGLLSIEVTKEFKESTVSKILELVENASSKKAPTESFITKFARYYTPIIVFSALILAIIPPLVISGETFSTWIYRSLVFLVVSCPCALVISIPLSFFGGIGGASKNGILIKGGNYLEALNSVDMVVFDKTGTLTKGVFRVSEIKPVEGIDKDQLLEYAAFAESYSNHPIATSILNAYGKEINKERIGHYNEISGYGIKIKMDDKEIIIGNTKLMERENISYHSVEAIGTVVYISIEGKYGGYILISDEIKDDSTEAIKSLKAIGIRKTIMLTGDNQSIATKIGKKLELDEVYSELLPNEKVEKIEMLDKQKGTKKKIVFIGDGINDAPVLARADIGVAMGGLGSDAAIEAADVVIMTDEPSKLVDAIKIAKKTKNIVWQNIIFALGIKGIVLLLGAVGMATMWEAVFADVGVAIIAVLNAMRVMKVK